MGLQVKQFLMRLQIVIPAIKWIIRMGAPLILNDIGVRISFVRKYDN
jgi:hypothetical protein